jgi:hypothetical protein
MSTNIKTFDLMSARKWVFLPIFRCGITEKETIMKQLVYVVLAGVALASCSTVTRGTTNQIQVVSTPSEAHVQTSIGNSCTTPCSFEVSRKSEFVATISKDGYQPMDVPVKTRVAGAGAAGFAGNLLVGGVVGMGVDAATGATLEHYPNPITVTLQPVAQVRAPAPQRPKKRKRVAGIDNAIDSRIGPTS